MNRTMTPSMIRCLMIVSILLIIRPVLLAQNAPTPTTHAISFFAGYHSQKNQDLIFSPLIYQGSSINALSVWYERKGSKGYHRLSISYDKIDVKAADLITFTDFNRSFSRIPSEAKELSILYGYAHTLKDQGRLTLQAGALLETNIYFTQYNMGLSEEEGYLLPTSLQPWFLLQYELNSKSVLEWEVYVPVLSWISRPEYAIVDNEEIQYEGSDLSFVYGKGKLTSFNHFRALNLVGSYTRQLSSRLGLRLRYRLNYSRHSDPLTISVLKHHVDLGLSCNF